MGYRGKIVKTVNDAGFGLRNENLNGVDFVIEDTIENIWGEDFMEVLPTLPVWADFVKRIIGRGKPLKEQRERMFYGKVGLFGHIFLESELNEEIPLEP